MIFYDRKIFRQILGRPTTWEYANKISFRNIETGRRIKILDHFFIDCFFKNDVIKYVIKVNLCILQATHFCYYHECL